ncbi:lyase family protein [Streptomyces sp. NBC_00094]|uniref:aspartate ammonia-lyase n=1 Tax=Streptomyces sp. NBC_00094 TaxID=2903620 RepID=UPI00225095AD|nr:lyase family protein [Streptomyces sp. NBC_00094]MCX5388743.1 lyase family protein [Streptomyces sp. NBC_00094]
MAPAPASRRAPVRREHDLLGDRDVPADAYWGAHTLRATENFAITGTPISVYPLLIDAFAAVKGAAARANEELGMLPADKAGAIAAACQEIRTGHLHDQFVVDVVQGGAGTSTNMNANEVVANRALELLGHAKGDYDRLHPHEDVNLGQSTNDVYPTAVRIATIGAARELLLAMALLQDAFADLIEATQDCGAFVQLSGVLKRIAVKLSKTCNDLRLLSSGPRVGLGEINLPPVQAGSSIMPGKVNPVIPEVVNQVAFEVIGNDITITMAAEAGQLQLNAFEPVVFHALSKSLLSLRAACLALADRCVSGITANTEALRAAVENSIGLATALNPHLGYTVATAIAQEALATGRGVVELTLEKGLLPASRLAELLTPQHLTGAPDPAWPAGLARGTAPRP